MYKIGITIALSDHLLFTVTIDSQKPLYCIEGYNFFLFVLIVLLVSKFSYEVLFEMRYMTNDTSYSLLPRFYQGFNILANYDFY